jgi:hypothetical protein
VREGGTSVGWAVGLVPCGWSLVDAVTRALRLQLSVLVNRQTYLLYQLQHHSCQLWRA